MKLEAHQLRKRFGGRTVLDRESLSLDGGALAVTGPNGCGKSTLLRIVAGVIAADAGFVTIGGDAVPAPPALARIGYVPEGGDPPEHLTVRELLALVAALKRAPRPAEPAMGAGELLHARIGSLSLGQRRRACLAAAMIGQPWLLVLDEPENGLDAAGAGELVDLLRRHVAGEGAVLLASHDEALLDAIGCRRHPLPRR
jgi:ABC-2 type transport system ATP-binding protein